MLKLLVDGGILMLPLVIMSIMAVGVVLDRWVAFRAYARVDNRSLRSQVMRLLWDGRVEEAALLCAQTPGPVAAVMLVGLQAYLKHHERASVEASGSLSLIVKEAMDNFQVNAVSSVEKRFSLLTVIGNAAPLVGMLGTVVGMIDSFEALAALGGSDKAAIARGISVALITTAGGLIVALVAVLPYNFFTAKADAVDLEIEDMKGQLIDTIAMSRERAQLAGAG